jgi:hypothetical protein
MFELHAFVRSTTSGSFDKALAATGRAVLEAIAYGDDPRLSPADRRRYPIGWRNQTSQPTAAATSSPTISTIISR